jgi:hypothetical protein
MNVDINSLIGIPFKLNHRSFDGCDCRGIVWLYHKYVNNKEYPFTDGKNIRFRDIKKDTQRMMNVISTFAAPVTFNELRAGDIIIIDNIGQYGALGVCVNNNQVLHIDKVVGSCLTKLKYIKEFFLIGYRPNV